MPEIFFTADHHFGHARIIEHCKRPFADVDEMTEELVARWNAVVGPHDDVWHLGDFACRMKPEALERVFRRLRGRKHLVVGNHDDKHVLRLPWSSEPKDRRVVRVPGEALPVICDHYAMRTWPKSHYGAVHLYGHSHGALPGVGRSVDVGVDVWDFRPVTLAELRPTLERQHEEFERQREAARLFRERAASGDPEAALAILRRVPDVAPEPGDEVQPHAKPMAVDEQAETFAALWKGNRDAAAAGVGYGARVVEDPEVMSGEPCVEGTRVPARTVLAYLKAGRSDVEIFTDYPTLPVDGIAAVRWWAAELGFGLPGDGVDGRLK